MNDSTLLKLSIGVSVVGLFFLAVGVSLKEPLLVAIEEISVSQRGELVTVTGYVEDVTVKNGHLFFRLGDRTGSIRIVFFRNDLERQNLYPLDLAEGMLVSVEGRVEVYKGVLEVVADRLTIL